MKEALDNLSLDTNPSHFLFPEYSSIVLLKMHALSCMGKKEKKRVRSMLCQILSGEIVKQNAFRHLCL